MAKPKIWITGVYGLLGQNLVRALSADHDLFGVDIIEPPFPLAGIRGYGRADITDRKAVTELWKANPADILINTAALTNVDACETEHDKAEAVNLRAVENLLAVCGPARFVQISTDYVFDGKSGPYSDAAEPNPISWYGKTKRWAEKAVLAASAKNLVVRSMVLVGKAKGLKPDFIHFVRSSLEAKKSIRIVTDQIGNVTLAANLSKNIGALLAAGTAGIVSMAGEDRLSRYDVAIKIANRYGLDRNLITPILTRDLNQAAPRPLESGFIHDRARFIPGVTLLPFNELLEEYDHE